MQIKIYTADTRSLENPELFSRLYSHTAPYRREKTDRMRFDKDKRQSLGAGVLLEYALKKEGVNDPQFSFEKNGKLCLADSSIRFNLSHSGTTVMCALSDSDIGCDVEQVKQVKLNIARRFFCADEYKALMNCDPNKQQELFFRYWTLKESFIKATGLGFELPLNSFCMHLDGQNITVEQSIDSREYHFKEFDLGSSCKYAVCSADKPFDDVCVRAVSFDAM